MAVPRNPKSPDEDPHPFSEVELEELRGSERRVTESMSRERVMARLEYLAKINPDKMVTDSKKRAEELRKLAGEQGFMPLSHLRAGDSLTVVLEKVPEVPGSKSRFEDFGRKAAQRFNIRPSTVELGKKALSGIRELYFGSIPYPDRTLWTTVRSVDEAKGQVGLVVYNDSNEFNVRTRLIGPHSIFRDQVQVMLPEDRLRLVGSAAPGQVGHDSFDDESRIGTLRQGDHPVVDVTISRLSSTWDQVAGIEAMGIKQVQVNRVDIFPDTE